MRYNLPRVTLTIYNTFFIFRSLMAHLKKNYSVFRSLSHLQSSVVPKYFAQSWGFKILKISRYICQKDF